MPIYEYECKKCGAHTEVMQKISDKPLTKCRKCGGRLEKLLSAPAIQFKGSGWYVTDYAGKKTDAKSEEKRSGDSSTTDAKPASKEASGNKKESSAKKSSAPSTSGD
jgi:putative FmdB family regulatory protein